MELSAATLDNWVAKTGSYLAAEYDPPADAVFRIDLPLHWLVPVWCQAAWSRGWAVTVTDTADIVITTATRSSRYPDIEDVLACSTTPFGTPLGSACPPHAVDALADLRSYPDQVVLPLPPAEAAVVVADGERLDNHAAIERAERLLAADCQRPLSTALPDTTDGLLLASLSWLCRGGTTVLVAEPEAADLAAIQRQEGTDCRV